MPDPRTNLLRDRATAVGVSFLVGDPISDVADLPEHHVEIHAFDDSNFSQAFVEGMSLAAGDRGNTLVWAWEPEHRDGMRHVLVARLDQPRGPGNTLADVVPVIVHQRNRWESKAIADHLAERHILDERERDAHAQMMAPLRAALGDAKIPVRDSARLWLRCGETVTINQESNGRYTLSCCTNYHKSQDDGPLIERYVAHFAALGFSLDPQEPYDLKGETADTPEAAAATARAMDEAVKGMDPIAKAFWQERFMEKFKLTRQLRLFLIGGAESRVYIGSHRDNLYLTAGGVTLKASDISDLVRAGYLLKGDRVYTVTPEGLAKAQEPAVRKPRTVTAAVS